MQIYESIVPEGLLAHVEGWAELHSEKGYTWADFASGTTGLAQTLAVANLLWPTLVEVEGYVFIVKFHAQFSPESRLHALREQFGDDKRRIERFVNAWAMTDFFRSDQFASAPELGDEALLAAFGSALQLLWTLRLQTVFPDREFVVELGENIEGEDGLAITVYEK